jgi:diaminopimelate decarboxylase
MAPAKNRDIGLRLSLAYVPSFDEAVVRPSPPMRFGISPDEVPHIVEKLKKHGYRVSEVMGHAGSLIRKNSAFVSILRELVKVAPYLDDPITLNIGGGLPFCYVNECSQIDVSELFDLLSAEQQKIASTLRKDVRIVLEPARLLSAPCALQVARINDIKVRTEKSRFLFCDAVLNSLGLSLPASILHAAGDRKDWSKDVLVSNLCVPDDSISEHIVGEAHIGDLVAIGGIGGYVMPLSYSLQSRTKPTEVVLHKSGEWSVIRKPIPNLSWFEYVQ